MSKKFTRSWLLEWTSEPLSEQDMRHPLDYEFLLAYRDGDVITRAKLETLVLEVLGEAPRQDLGRATPWTHRVDNLANLVSSMELRDAVPELLKLADLCSQETVLAALANLQEPLVLWDFWQDRWRQGDLDLEPVVFAGLLGSDPVRILQLIPSIVATKVSWLGEGLWALATHEGIPEGSFAKVTRDLNKEEKQACRDALKKICATQEEITTWIPLKTS